MTNPTTPAEPATLSGEDLDHAAYMLNAEYRRQTGGLLAHSAARACASTVLNAARPTTPAEPATLSGEGESFNDLADAPKDGSLVRLLVDYSGEDADHALEDTTGLSWTVGFNNLSNTEEDTWQFVGWSWQSDCFCDGRGEVIGWAPLGETRPAPAAAPADDVRALRVAAQSVCDDASLPDSSKDCNVELYLLDNLRAALARLGGHDVG